MEFHLSVSLLAMLGALCAPIAAANGPGWVSLSLTGPDALKIYGDNFYHAQDVLIGTPSTARSPVVNIWSGLLAVSSSDCVFCPGSDLFDPNLSSTYQTNGEPWNNATDIGGIIAHEKFSFGGVLISQNKSLSAYYVNYTTDSTLINIRKAVFEQMSLKFFPRVPDGMLGLWVDPINETRRESHILTYLHSSGQLLNPVVGLSMGRAPEKSHLTIGALDPNHFEGSINWVAVETPDPSWILPLVIKVDGFRGFNNSLLPSRSPGSIFAYLDSLTLSVAVPDVKAYMAQEGYRGPADVSVVDDADGFYIYRCNDTGGAYAHLSVDINGVNYPIDSQGNLLQNSTADSCEVGITDNSVGTGDTSVESTLGLTFLRSVYVAYRFPTPDCPTAFYGFAFQRGANRTSSMISQQPRSTPTESLQCLSLTTPTSTPSLSTPPRTSTDMFLSENGYSIWGRPDEKQVRLKGVEYMQASHL